MKCIDVLGVRVAATNLSNACQTIEHWISEKEKTYVCIAPVSTVVDSQKNEKYRNIVNSAGMTAPDGMPLVWIGKLTGNADIERTYGPDLLIALSKLSEQKGFKCFFYGGTSETNQLLIKKLEDQFPGIKIVGHIAPPFRNSGELEKEDILEQINKADPDILWVGLGSPKQDYWMHNHRSKLNVPVIIGVGAAFDFVAGVKPQAPLWMRRGGLEWFFRLCNEPRRLWRRYLIGNTTFIYLLIKSAIKGKFVGKA